MGARCQRKWWRGHREKRWNVVKGRARCISHGRRRKFIFSKGRQRESSVYAKLRGGKVMGGGGCRDDVEDEGGKKGKGGNEGAVLSISRRTRS